MAKKESIRQRRNKVNAVQDKALSLFQQRIFTTKDFIAIERICDRARNKLK